jgi:hypothetical protein
MNVTNQPCGPDFIMNFIGVFREDAILKEITETVLIDKAQFS